MHDTIVIGAGFAGITAARDLKDKGRSVCVLEARDRIGGRTHYDLLEGLDQKVEFGGTWVVPRYQKYVAHEIERYGVELTSSPEAENSFWVFGGERRAEALPVPMSELADLERAIADIIADAKRISFGEPFETQHLQDLDVPFSEWLDKHEIGGATRDLFASYGGALCFGVDPSQVSALHVISWVAGLGNSAWELFNGPTIKFAHGTVDLLTAMAEGLDIRLSTPVATIDQSGDSVVVTAADGTEYAARSVIVAIPLNVWKDVAFTPALSKEKQAFADQELAGKAVKLWALVKNTPRYFGALGWNTRLQWLSTEFERDEGSVMVGFAISADDVNVDDPETIRAAVAELCPDAEVTKWWTEDWNSDPYSRGTWTAFRPGQVFQLHGPSRSTEGRIVFAGADVAVGFSGWIDGAIESGARAAHEIDTAPVPGNEEGATVGYVRTEDEVRRIQGLLSPSRYVLEGVSLEFETTPEFVESVLPPCFEPHGTRGLATTTVWQAAVCGEFESCAVMIYASYKGVVGTYFLTLVVSGDMPVVLGRELWGEPKKRGTAQLFRDGDDMYGYGERNGTRLIQIDATFDEDLGPQDSETYALEVTGRLNHRGELAAAPEALVFGVQRRMQSVRAGRGSLTLQSGTFDPVGDIPVLSCGRALHYTGEASYDEVSRTELTGGIQYLPYILGRSFDDLTQHRRPRRHSGIIDVNAKVVAS